VNRTIAKIIIAVTGASVGTTITDIDRIMAADPIAI
jgi:hypothetical protein